MKTIVIISPDTVPLPLKENFPETIIEGKQEFSTLDKCVRTTAPGKRSWRFAEYLSKEKEFDVTLLIPDLNYPPDEYIDHSKITFKIESYNFKAANWNWSEELDKKLLKFDFVIIQTTAGTGFLNASALPHRNNLIVDGWIPFITELPCILLTYPRMYRKINWSTKFLPQYQNLLKRANCVLYANRRQQHFYEGIFYGIQKLDWSSFKFSPTLYVPYGIDSVTNIKREELDPSILRLLWYGPVYPWYEPELLLDTVKGRDDICIDFVGIVHPRYKRIYKSYYKKFFEEARKYKNIKIVEEYCDDDKDLFKKYHAGIVIARNWLEEKYSHRCRILNMLSKGLPVILNEGNTLYEELPFLGSLLWPISTTNILDNLLLIKEYKMKGLLLPVSEEDLNDIYKILNWENVIAPLVDYIKRFSTILS